MRPDILIVGQGLAGTLLAWELERAGIAFAIADAGHGAAATSVAAGLVTPITGRRLVKSWRVDALLPAARAAYRELESALEAPLWRELRVRRFFADERERAVFAAKRATGELAPFAGEAEADGFWIEGAARVDLPLLLRTARERWRRAGRWREAAVRPEDELGRHATVIDCRGLAGALGAAAAFRRVPWEFSKGELLEVRAPGLRPDVVLHRGHWLLPSAGDRAWVGATHQPGVTDATPTAQARAALAASAARLLGAESAVLGQRAGVRVNFPDKRPAAGRSPEVPQLGLINGLGAKGALWAPLLAREWAGHLAAGAAFDPAIDVRRFCA